MAARHSKQRILFALLAFRLMVGLIVAVWSPHAILSAHPGGPFAELVPVTLAGAFLVVAGLLAYIRCAWDFAMIGISFEPAFLVARGTYRIVRHPMYSSLTLILFGESLLFKSWRVLAYACVSWMMAHIFVMLYEEPSMVKKWGTAYAQYSARVPRWIPRIRRSAA
jgi:protein-S-isoprenylcysteine O-methyltransferase Ste14